MNLKTFEELEVQGKRVLVRVDFNVPLDGKLKIRDDARIVKTLPTIRNLIQRKARIVLMSHLGRPKGKRDPKLSLQPVATHLAKLLKRPVAFVPDAVGPTVTQKLKGLKNGSVALLENLRFYAGEEANDPEFAKSLADLGDLYVNDAFGAAHRAHASTTGIAKHLPAAAGSLLAKEVEYFDRALQNPEHPFIAILGGAKVTDKIKVIENLMKRVDAILIGGAMAYTFLKARGHRIGNSKFDAEGFETAKRLLASSKANGPVFALPVDHVISETVTEDSKVDQSELDIPDGWIGVDIGPKTVERFQTVLKKAKTVVWNGPVGVFEIQPFSNGTREIAKCLASLDAVTIVGGGETAQAIAELGLEDKISHVSTGGGASLEYLEGKKLPGIEALTK